MCEAIENLNLSATAVLPSGGAAVNGQQFSRDSFDRFGDDLSELILGHLAFGDKIRFECVARQWRRLVFVRQENLSVYSYVRNADTLKELMRYDPNAGHYSLNPQLLERVLSKFSAIKRVSIEFFDHIKFCFDSNQILDIVSGHCPRLEEFYLRNDRNKCSDASVIRLGERCGRTLLYVTIDSLSKAQMKLLLSLTPNVRSVCYDVSLFGECGPDFLPRLDEIRFWRTPLSAFKTFPTRFYPQLRKINFVVNDTNYCGDDLNEALAIISRFENLRTLDLDIEFNEKPIDEQLRVIGVKCRHLQTLNLTLNGNLISGHFLQTIGLFRALRSLECRLFDVVVRDENFECLKSVENLSRLLLFSDSRVSPITDSHLSQINEYLPNLASIQLTSVNISDSSLEHLARLSRLTNIYLSLTDSVRVTNAGICRFFGESLAIRSFDLSLNFAIGGDTIESMIACANRKPKVQHQIFLYCTNSNEEIQALLSNIHLPNNLTIDVSNYN